MTTAFRLLLPALLAGLLLAATAHAQPFQREDFVSLDRWEHNKFPTDKPSIYRLVPGDEGKQVLAVESAGTCSAMLSKDVIDLAQTPVLRWRWKVSRRTIAANWSRCQKQATATTGCWSASASCTRRPTSSRKPPG